MSRKRICLRLVFIISLLLFFDLWGHLYYRAKSGVFLWEVSLFRVRPFTYLVDDDRLITNKKNFTYVDNDWLLETDSNGFRLGTNKYSREEDSIVFLGDSVPFGWRLNGGESVPSKSYDLLKKKFSLQYGVINAAIPAYSLYQAIKRYEYEIDGKFNVKYVILQSYDPVQQFVIWGRKWDKKTCWTSKDTLTLVGDLFKQRSAFSSFLHRYSSVYHLIHSLRLRRKMIEELPEELDMSDKQAFSLFREEILDILGTFYARLKEQDIILILLPVNPTVPLTENPTVVRNNIDKKTKCLIVASKLNNVLQEFASSRSDVYFFDVVEYFNTVGRKGLFIDSHCHLSRLGAEKQAAFILGQMRVNGLLGIPEIPQ